MKRIVKKDDASLTIEEALAAVENKPEEKTKNKASTVDIQKVVVERRKKPTPTNVTPVRGRKKKSAKLDELGLCADVNTNSFRYVENHDSRFRKIRILIESEEIDELATYIRNNAPFNFEKKTNDALLCYATAHRNERLVNLIINSFDPDPTAYEYAAFTIACNENNKRHAENRSNFINYLLDETNIGPNPSIPWIPLSELLNTDIVLFAKAVHKMEENPDAALMENGKIDIRCANSILLRHFYRNGDPTTYDGNPEILKYIIAYGDYTNGEIEELIQNSVVVPLKKRVSIPNPRIMGE